MAPSESLEALVRRLFAAFDARDLEAFVADRREALRDAGLS